MNNAELYKKNHALQKRDTIDCLEEYAAKIKWKDCGARVIDIGCGDGSTTADILKSFVPKHFDLIIGADVSERMVKFANEHHGCQRVLFMRLNIETRLPEDLEGRFDHAFSFFTLHWVKRQTMAFTNIFNMLTEGGSCLVLFTSHMPIYDVYRILAKNSKWSAYLQDVDKFTSPYHDSQNPEEELRVLMKGIGFTNVDVREQEKSFVYNDPDTLKKALKAVNPFSIPDDKWQDYMSDYIQVLREMKMLEENNNGKGRFCVSFKYKMLLAMGRK